MFVFIKASLQFIWWQHLHCSSSVHMIILTRKRFHNEFYAFHNFCTSENKHYVNTCNILQLFGKAISSMRIAVLGATGQTGQYLVKQAIQKGYGVTAVVRNPKKVALQHERLKVSLSAKSSEWFATLYSIIVQIALYCSIYCYVSACIKGTLTVMQSIFATTLPHIHKALLMHSKRVIMPFIK